MRIAVAVVGSRREQSRRSREDRCRSDRRGRLNLALMTLPWPPQPDPVLAILAIAPPPRTADQFRWPLHRSKSSSPWSGAMCTRPVPLSVVTKSPDSNGRVVRKENRRDDASVPGNVPARSEPLPDQRTLIAALDSSEARSVRFRRPFWRSRAASRRRPAASSSTEYSMSGPYAIRLINRNRPRCFVVQITAWAPTSSGKRALHNLERYVDLGSRQCLHIRSRPRPRRSFSTGLHITGLAPR